MMSQEGYTAKDKAKELITKINNCTVSVHDSKKLALLFCNEIINYEFFGSHTQEYWKSVKKEVEKIV